MGDIRGDAAWPATVGQRLRRPRNRWSLGRDGELELLRAALGAPQPPFAVLHGSTVRFHTVAHTTADTIDASTDPPTVTGVKVNFDRLRCG